MKECPDPMEDITIPRVKPMDTVYPKDVQEAKALDASMTEASNRLLCATTYLFDVLQNLKDESDPQLTEGIFRSLCLVSSATSMLEVERLLRPGDRPMVKDKAARIDIPSVIQEVRRSAPTVTSPDQGGGVLRTRDDLEDFLPVKKKHSTEPPPELFTDTFRHQTRRSYSGTARQGYSGYGRGSYRGSGGQYRWARRAGGSSGSSSSSSSNSRSPP
jgi:hypothetical protein